MQNTAVTFERKTDVLGQHVQNLIEEFFERFWDGSEVENWEPAEQRIAAFYRTQFEDLKKDSSRSTIVIDITHIKNHDTLLCDAILDRYFRFEPFIKNALTSINMRFVNNTLQADVENKDIWVAFYNLPLVLKVRDLKTQYVGKLTCISGTVTRTNQVRPELLKGRFQCLDCQTFSDFTDQQFKYTEPIKCRNAACQNTKRWHLVVAESKFCDWQKVKIQENSEEIPSGSMPRSIDVILRNDAVELAKAGDKCRFVGSLVVVPEVAKMFSGLDRQEVVRALPGGNLSATEGRSDTANPNDGTTGLRQLGVRDLNHKLCFLATTVYADGETAGHRMLQKDTGDHEENFTQEENERIEAMIADPNLVKNLAMCIAPNVWGHEDIKIGILLQLFGGVHKVTTEGIHLRGDINVCIVGDPSVAKSQFLKYAQRLIPRAVYTSGKASSASGLTASVIKDAETREFSIEAGALMLADNGLCCIDEFDKMDVNDQVAIHEAMEQQTISIAKAGIKATLNARTCILAAANPIGGRYDVRKPLKANVGLSPPIMSRFDLFFVVLDNQDSEADRKLADHIVGLHQEGEESLVTPYSPDMFLLFRRKAKCIEPILSEMAGKILAASFCEMRQNDKTTKNNNYRITTRQLESMIRLSEAVARVHCSSEVKPEHVKLALRIMRASFTRVESARICMEIAPGDGESQPKKDISVEIYRRIRTLLLTRLSENETVIKEGLQQDLLKQWYVTTLTELNEQVLLKEIALVDLVIHRLIAEDAMIILSEEQTAVEERLLCIHPNLSLDSIASEAR